MTGVRKSLNWTQSGDIAEAVSAESCHIVLETSPPEYVQKISRYLQLSAGESKPDLLIIDREEEEEEEEESGSGDSLFITQKLPEAVRTERRRRYSLRSSPTSPRELEDSEDGTTSSASHKESKIDKKRARKKITLPKFTFPFLKEMKRKPRKTLLSVQQNTRLHNTTMGGFFTCVRELWEGYERGHDAVSSLPTLDMDWEYISPLSEHQEDGSDDEDIKVVEKKRFVVPSKVKCSQPWYTPAKRDSQATPQRRMRMRKRATSQEMFLEDRKKVLQKVPGEASVSRITLSSLNNDSSDDGDPPCKVLIEREKGDTSILTHTEMPKAERHPTRETNKICFREKVREEELCDDSDATFCEPPNSQRSPVAQTPRDNESDLTDITETQTHALHTDDLPQTEKDEDEPESQSLLQGHTNNESLCSETKVKKKKKKSKGLCVRAEGKGQSQGEEEGPHASQSVIMEAKEISSPAEAPALSDDHMLRQEEKNIPDSTQMQKKRKKNKSGIENIGQKLDGNLVSDEGLGDSGFLVTCSLKNADDKMEEEKKSKGDHVRIEGVGQSHGDEEGPHSRESLNMEAEETSIPPEDNRAEALALSDDDMLRQEEKDIPDSTPMKKKRKKNKSAVEKIRQKPNENLESEAGLEDSGLFVKCSLENTGERRKKKKKKKKKKKRKSVVEDDEQLQSSAIAAEPLHEDGEMQREKKQREKAKSITVTEECVENAAALQETLECSHQYKQQSCYIKHDEDVNLSSDVKYIGHTGLSLKKKKKRKSISEAEEGFYSPEKSKKVKNADASQKKVSGADDQDIGQTVKKKKKKREKMSEICSSNNTVEQSDDPESVRKTRTTSSFLHADAEENHVQWHQQQSSSPTASRVWCAKNPGVSTSDAETETAEVAENPSDEVRKRKRKKLTTLENVEDGHEPEFKNPNRACQSASPAATHTDLKRKKKRKRTESVCVTPVEKLDTDEGQTEVEEAVVLQRKRGKKKWKEHEVRTSSPN